MIVSERNLFIFLHKYWATCWPYTESDNSSRFSVNDKQLIGKNLIFQQDNDPQHVTKVYASDLHRGR